MIKLLVKKTIKNHENVTDMKVRKGYGILGGVLGIICNSFLFIVKLTLGILMSSMAIITDAFNNLSDMGSSIISVFSAKMAAKKPDHEHPFGHGRIEYICSLIVAFVIVFAGIQLAIASVEKLIAQDDNVKFNWVMLGIFSISILVKVWMILYNRYLGKKIGSSVLKATAIDSLSDVCTSSLIIISMIVGQYVLPNFPLDGVMGTLVAIIIVINGIKLIIGTSNDLLGKKVDRETIEEIEKIILEEEDIIGVHDLIVHDYGPGRKMASIHAEVNAKSDIVQIHEIIDALEERVEEKMGIHMVIHMDPISIDCEKVNFICQKMDEFLEANDDKLSYHDLRITDGNNKVNIIFDVVIPYDYDKINIGQFSKKINSYFKEINPIYNLVIKIDYE